MAARCAEVLAAKLGLDDLEVEGRRVLVRVDFNVPVRDRTVTDTTRIVAALPTLRHLLEGGAALILASHRGRPRGRPDPELSLRPVAAALEETLGCEVGFWEEPVAAAAGRAGEFRPGEVVLLENLRFDPGETANSPDLSGALAALAPLYVNDAFGASHRPHASIVGVPQRVEAAAAGLLLVREVEILSRALEAPPKPFVLVVGGAKVRDKLDVVLNLLPSVDRLVVGGAMANALLAAEGRPVGRSRLEEGAAEAAARLLEEARRRGVRVELPEDFVVAPGPDRPEAARPVREVPAQEMALDIGPASRERFAAAVGDARTVVWNGPMGVFEVGAFAAGTRALAEAIARLGPGALTLVGGGDTAAAAAAFGVTGRVTHVSTGGGAALDLLSGAVLPGVAALTDRPAGRRPLGPRGRRGGGH